MDISPTQDLVIIRRIEDPEPVTNWGFVLPDTDEHAKTPYRGIVLFAGPGRTPKLSGAGKAVVEALRNFLAVNDPEVWKDAAEALAAHDALPDRVPMQVKAGDTVIFSKNLYQEFTINGEVVTVTQQDSILGILESDS